MTRPLRININGGWYHVTARGIERRPVFGDERDYGHFLDLLAAMCERYGVKVHTYVLMGNHYHLLIETPHSNASRAMQWLNVSYSVWFNRRHRRCGPLFQGRFKSVLVDGEGGWALEASVYIHLNPVRVSSLGLGKARRREEGRGLSEPTPEQVRNRLAELRGYRWSSYRAYAGYAPVPCWLTCDELWLRAKRGKRENGAVCYRELAEGWIRHGEKAERYWDRLKAGMAIGSVLFLERAKKLVKGDKREQKEVRQWKRLMPFGQVVKAVEGVKGESWDRFRDRQGDNGRDLVLWVARKRCGLTLRELGKAVGGMEYFAVSKAIKRMSERLRKQKSLRLSLRGVENHLSNVQT